MPATPTKNKACITYGNKPKERFGTREEAVAERERRYATGMHAPHTLGAYRCEHCPYFHVAHRRPDAATRNGSRGVKRSSRRGGRR